MKRETTTWGKVFANHIFDKSLVCGIFKECSSENDSQPNLKKMSKNVNGHLTEKGRQLANKHIKRCSMSLSLQKCQLKLQYI